MSRRSFEHGGEHEDVKWMRVDKKVETEKEEGRRRSRSGERGGGGGGEGGVGGEWGESSTK